MTPDEKLRSLLAEADNKSFGNPRAAADWVARTYAKWALGEAARKRCFWCKRGTMFVNGQHRDSEWEVTFHQCTALNERALAAQIGGDDK